MTQKLLTNEDMESVRINGLSLTQIIFLAQYYESMTGKDPRQITFGEK